MASDKVPAIGIDLGTTYSCVGVMQSGKVEILANNSGNRTTPSCVAYEGNSQPLIGESAKRQMIFDPTNTIYDSKRLIGRRFNDPWLQTDMKHWSFDVRDGDGEPMIILNSSGNEEPVHPETITSQVLSCMKETAELFVGETIRDAVITVPANFNSAQRQATREACKESGLNVLRLINEPTAAAIAYSWDLTGGDQRTILVFDIGGGTFDVSLVSIHDGNYEVKATAGDTHLGGQDFKNRLVTHLAQQFKVKYVKDISKNKRALSKLSHACEVAKRELSHKEHTRICIDCLYETYDFQATVTRDRFEELNADLFQRVLDPVKQVFKDSGLSKDEIDDILMAGGSSRIPKIQQLLQDFFPGKKLHKNINPDEAVAFGAAVYAAFLNGDNPGRMKNVVLRDVCPLSLGVGLVGGAMETAIQRNTVIPVTKSIRIVTSADHQTSLSSDVYEGERPLGRDNLWLGTMEMSGLPSRLAGKVEFETVFELDADGILTVTRTCTDAEYSGGSVTLTDNKARPSREEAVNMVTDSIVHKEEDDQQRDRIASMDKLLFAIRDIRDALDEQESKFSTNEQELIRTKCKNALDWWLTNTKADKERFESERKDLLDTCKPVFDRVGAKFPFK